MSRFLDAEHAATERFFLQIFFSFCLSAFIVDTSVMFHQVSLRWIQSQERHCSSASQTISPKDGAQALLGYGGLLAKQPVVQNFISKVRSLLFQSKICEIPNLTVANEVGIPYSKCSTILVVTGIVGGWWIQCVTMNEWYWNDTEWSRIVFLMEEILHQQCPMFHIVS